MSLPPRTAKDYKDSQAWTRAQEMEPLLTELEQLESWTPCNVGASDGSGLIKRLSLPPSGNRSSLLNKETAIEMQRVIQLVLDNRAGEVRKQLDRLVGVNHMNLDM